MRDSHWSPENLKVIILLAKTTLLNNNYKKASWLTALDKATNKPTLGKQCYIGESDYQINCINVASVITETLWLNFDVSAEEKWRNYMYTCLLETQGSILEKNY